MVVIILHRHSRDVIATRRSVRLALYELRIRRIVEQLDIIGQRAGEQQAFLQHWSTSTRSSSSAAKTNRRTSPER